MAQSHLHHALIVMLAMGLPDPLAAHGAPDQRQRGIADERRENEHRKPQRPDVAHPSDDAEGAGEKTERDRPDVSEEDARRMEIEDEEAKRCAGQGAARERQLGVA